MPFVKLRRAVDWGYEYLAINPTDQYGVPNAEREIKLKGIVKVKINEKVKEYFIVKKLAIHKVGKIEIENDIAHIRVDNGRLIALDEIEVYLTPEEFRKQLRKERYARKLKI